MAQAYAEAYLLKRRVNNEEMWLQGVYMCHALQSVVGTMFGKSKIKYIEKPLEIYGKTKAEKEQEVRSERQRLINYLDRLKRSSDLRQGVGKHG